MTVLTKAVALLEAAEFADLEAMPPAHRRRLADLFHRWAKAADPEAPRAPRSGVLLALQDGRAA